MKRRGSKGNVVPLREGSKGNRRFPLKNNFKLNFKLLYALEGVKGGLRPLYSSSVVSNLHIISASILTGWFLNKL